ncbi:MAG: SDR family oxidoreductase [Leeuwenhoekiella sp.]
MDLQLKNKRAFISGSTKGIGKAIAKSLAAEGAEVIINGRSINTVDKVIAEIMADLPGAKITGFACDFSKPEEINKLIEEINEVDILINNVGIFGETEFPNIDDETWQKFYDVNVMSGVRLSRAFLPGMLAKDWGRIIFISSESAVNIPVEMIHYGMTKTAQLALSRGLAEMTKGTNVTVNSVLPGPTFSDGVQEMTGADQDADRKEIEKQFFSEARPTSLIQRFADPEEVAHMVTYVASPLSSATNGASLRVDGGVVKSILP